MTVTVIGLGKIGLPLAVQIASSGRTVLGTDIDPRVVDLVNAGEPPFPGEADLDVAVKFVVDTGTLAATVDVVDAVRRADTVIVLVPVVTNEAGEPDFRALDRATADIAQGVQPGTLIGFETTLPVGTTRNRLAARIANESGLTVEENLFVFHSPERVFSGRVFQDLRRYPKLVGGVGPKSTDKAVAFYESVLDFDQRTDLPRPNGAWNLGSAEAAEFAKLMETTYRDVNIALANEFARYADRIDVDVQAVIDAANSQPFSHVHSPGVAVGGHCIPVYPRLYLSGDPEAAIPAAARRVNESMPAYAVQLLADRLGDLRGLRIVVLGVSYRGDVKEHAFSGVFPLVRELEQRGAEPVVHDPFYTGEELTRLGLNGYQLGTPCDAAILQATHAAYADLTPEDLPGVRAILDGRRHLHAARWGAVRLIRLGAAGMTGG